jgi:hypothetical protein
MNTQEHITAGDEAGLTYGEVGWFQNPKGLADPSGFRIPRAQVLVETLWAAPVDFRYGLLG